MPELPEVETIVRALRDGGRGADSVLGKRIINADVFWDRSIQSPSAGKFIQQIKDNDIEDISRRGKYIQIRLSKSYLFFHLRMSGDIVIEEGRTPIHKHVRVKLDLDDGRKISFYNPRKFGRVWLVDDPHKVIGKLGIEPFDSSLNKQTLHKMLGSKKRQLKPLLMDQSFIAGLGNIYTDEALHMSKLHPLTISDQVSLKKSGDLLNSIREVLKTGIKNNGASFDWMYKGGEFQNQFRVFHRKNKDCPVCSTKIVKMVVGQRGTHICPKCQKTPRLEEK